MVSWADLAPAAHRDVVEEDRQVGRRRHRPEVRGEPGLRGTAVVGGDHEHPVGTAASAACG